MRNAYRPLHPVPKGAEADARTVAFCQQLQQDSDARFAGVEWAMVETVLPVSGGTGFRCQWYRDGLPIERQPA